MNVRTLIAAAAIVGLSACTAQQRQMASNAIADEPAAEVAGPSVIASADCSVVHYEITNRGDVEASVNIGSQPPYRANVNGDIAVSDYDSTHAFWASVYVGDVKLWEQFVDCTTS